MRRLADRSPRELTLLLLPLLIALVAGLWIAARYLRPAPPTRVVMATGGAGGGYAEFGEAYRRILARHGVTLDLRNTEGSVDNYRLLREPGAGVSVALMQSGIARPDEAPELVSLGAVAYEPLWIFCRGERPYTRLAQLRGKRLAVGLPGSGTRMLALGMLADNGLDEDAVSGVHVTGIDGAEALLTGAVDCLFVIAPPQAGIIRAIMHAPGVSLMALDRTEAYVRRLPYLSRLVLPQGVMDLERDIPPQDVPLVAATAQIVVRRDLHPAIAMLLLQAATEVHRAAGVFQHEGEFPAARTLDLPLSEDALRYHRSGPPLLQRYLPFWLANLADRLIVVLLPLLAVVIPLSRLVPPLYRWRMRSRIYRWYGQLMFIENETRTGLTVGERRDFGVRLDTIERTVNRLKTPLAYADQLYALRQHIDFVREKVARAEHEPNPGNPT